MADWCVYITELAINPRGLLSYTQITGQLPAGENKDIRWDGGRRSAHANEFINGGFQRNTNLNVKLVQIVKMVSSDKRCISA